MLRASRNFVTLLKCRNLARRKIQNDPSPPIGIPPGAIALCGMPYAFTSYRSMVNPFGEKTVPQRVVQGNR